MDQARVHFIMPKDLDIAYIVDEATGQVYYLGRYRTGSDLSLCLNTDVNITKGN